MELGGLWWTNVLNLALPPQRLRPDAQLEHPVSHTAQKKREKKMKERKKKTNKIKVIEIKYFKILFLKK